MLPARECGGRMVTPLKFSRREWGIILMIGVLTPLIDSRIEVLLVQFFGGIANTINVFSFTGGPLNGDALVAWEEYGAVVAAYIVRKPGAATAAMTINGFGQFIVDGFQGPHHLLYGLAGLGADAVFAAFRYKRFDLTASALAGMGCQTFWIPVTYAYHNVLGRFSSAFIVGDVLTRLVVGALADGVLGAVIGWAILRLFRQTSKTASSPKDSLWDGNISEQSKVGGSGTLQGFRVEYFIDNGVKV
jgi:energy-coupling factor transport system permease protein